MVLAGKDIFVQGKQWGLTGQLESDTAVMACNLQLAGSFGKTDDAQQCHQARHQHAVNSSQFTRSADNHVGCCDASTETICFDSARPGNFVLVSERPSQNATSKRPRQNALSNFSNFLVLS